MITAPLYVLLLLYFLFLAIFIIFSCINLWHVYSTGNLTFTSFAVTVIVGIATILVLYATWTLLQDIVWTERFTLWNNDWITGSFSPYSY
ncbi:MAG TPA: hypothetical protein VJH75_01125 [Patescibacteria group bacterium]|nr:hypothetical protein [Patescibacteria group bacterium]